MLVWSHEYQHLNNVYAPRSFPQHDVLIHWTLIWGCVRYNMNFYCEKRTQVSRPLFRQQWEAAKTNYFKPWCFIFFCFRSEGDVQRKWHFSSIYMHHRLYIITTALPSRFLYGKAWHNYKTNEPKCQGNPDVGRLWLATIPLARRHS